MKHKMPKRPTRKQKELISKEGYVPKNWLVLDQDNNSIVIINKKSNRRKVILC